MMDRLSVRYREFSGLESADSGSDASDGIGQLPMSTAVFGAPILPSKRSGTDGSHDDADIHLLVASHHGSPSFPYEGDRLAGRSLQRSMMPVGFLKVKRGFADERVLSPEA
jgi:hypothetical protein